MINKTYPTFLQLKSRLEIAHKGYVAAAVSKRMQRHLLLLRKQVSGLPK